jgi:hypothetical protein
MKRTNSKAAKKLNLRKQTVRTLASSELANANGGALRLNYYNFDANLKLDYNNILVTIGCDGTWTGGGTTSVSTSIS